MIKSNMKFLLIVTILFFSLIGYSQPRTTYTTISDGNWIDGVNWDVGVPSNNQTNGSDDIIITHNITLNGDLSVKTGTTILVEGCDTLHVTGSVEFSNGSSIIVEPCAVLIIDGNLTNNNNSVNVQINGTVIIAGDYSGGNGSELGGSGDMEIDGSVTTDGDATVFGSTEDCITNCDNSSDEPLPIELISFDCELDGEDVNLKWVTSSEINNSHYLVEYSMDGENWGVINLINGVGNTNQITVYNTTHRNPINGYNYYKLTQVDFDGNYETFNTIVCQKYSDNGGVRIVEYYTTIGQLLFTTDDVNEKYNHNGLVIIKTTYKNGKINVKKIHIDNHQ